MLGLSCPLKWYHLLNMHIYIYIKICNINYMHLGVIYLFIYIGHLCILYCEEVELLLSQLDILILILKVYNLLLFVAL